MEGWLAAISGLVWAAPSIVEPPSDACTCSLAPNTAPGRAGLLTQAPLSPGGFGFATQLADTQLGLPAGGPEGQGLAAGGNPTVAHLAAAEDERSHSQAGSVGHQPGGAAGDGADSRRASGSWLLAPFGNIAARFRRQAEVRLTSGCRFG